MAMLLLIGVDFCWGTLSCFSGGRNCGGPIQVPRIGGRRRGQKSFGGIPLPDMHLASYRPTRTLFFMALVRRVHMHSTNVSLTIASKSKNNNCKQGKDNNRKQGQEQQLQASQRTTIAGNSLELNN